MIIIYNLKKISVKYIELNQTTCRYNSYRKGKILRGYNKNKINSICLQHQPEKLHMCQ